MQAEIVCAVLIAVLLAFSSYWIIDTAHEESIVTEAQGPLRNVWGQRLEDAERQREKLREW